MESIIIHQISNALDFLPALMFAAENVCWGFVVDEMTITRVCLWTNCHCGFTRTHTVGFSKVTLSPLAWNFTYMLKLRQQAEWSRFLRLTKTKLHPCFKIVIETMNYWAVTAELRAWFERPVPFIQCNVEIQVQALWFLALKRDNLPKLTVQTLFSRGLCQWRIWHIF